MENKSSSLRSFTELLAWQKAREVRIAISLLVKTLPAQEKFRLVDQIVRSSRGPCSNIAEGYGRFHEKDNARFCRMARASLYETLDHLSVAFDEKYIDAATLKSHWVLVEGTIRILNGYLRYLQGLGLVDGVAEPEAAYGEVVPIFAEAPTDLALNDPGKPDN